MTDEPETYRTKTGRVLTDSDIQALADEAERGYDVEPLAKRPGRPRMGSAPAVVVPVRLHADLLAAVKARAAAESTSLSELVRDARLLGLTPLRQAAAFIGEELRGARLEPLLLVPALRLEVVLRGDRALCEERVHPCLLVGAPRRETLLLLRDAPVACLLEGATLRGETPFLVVAQLRDRAVRGQATLIDPGREALLLFGAALLEPGVVALLLVETAALEELGEPALFVATPFLETALLVQPALLKHLVGRHAKLLHATLALEDPLLHALLFLETHAREMLLALEPLLLERPRERGLGFAAGQVELRAQLRVLLGAARIEARLLLVRAQLELLTEACLARFELLGVARRLGGEALAVPLVLGAAGVRVPLRVLCGEERPALAALFNFHRRAVSAV